MMRKIALAIVPPMERSVMVDNAIFHENVVVLVVDVGGGTVVLVVVVVVSVTGWYTVAV